MGRWFDPICFSDLNRKDVPRKDGVYLWSSDHQKGVTESVLYIGKAKCLRTRIAKHISGHGSPGLFQMLKDSPQTVYLQWRTVPPGQDPGHLESDLLNEYEETFGKLPRFNKIHGSRSSSIANTLHVSTSLLHTSVAAFASSFIGSIFALSVQSIMEQ
jgi:hypothetical protein